MSLLLLCCCRHSTAAMLMTSSIQDRLSNNLNNVQKGFVFNRWNPSIRYDDTIKHSLSTKIRVALKKNHIKILHMTINEEDYYAKQISFYLYHRILSYYTNAPLLEYEPITLEKNIMYIVPEDEVEKIEKEYMEIFRTNMVTFKNQTLDLNTTNRVEQKILEEKFQRIVLDILDKIDMDNIMKKLKTTYENMKNEEQQQLNELRNLM